VLEHAKSPHEAQYADGILAPAETPAGELSHPGHEPSHHPGSGPLLGGHGNLLDDAPAGSAARKRAHDPLANKFEVVSDKKYQHDLGHRDPNEVTHKEFHKLRHLFNDIRDGDGDLKVGMQGHAKNAAMNDIARIMQTRGGRQLIEGLDHADHTTKLEAGGVPQTVASRPQHESDHVGTSATVDYTPGKLLDIPGAKDRWAHDVRSDVVLFHELVHAKHDTDGTIAQGTLGRKDAVDPNDVGIPDAEYQAVGLGAFHKGLLNENAYRRARRKIGENSDEGVVHGDKHMPIRTRYVPDQR